MTRQMEPIDRVVVLQRFSYLLALLNVVKVVTVEIDMYDLLLLLNDGANMFYALLHDGLFPTPNVVVGEIEDLDGLVVGR